MKKYKTSLFGFDFPLTTGVDISDIRVCGMESGGIDDISGETVSGVNYFIKGITKQIRDDLLAGKVYLEFWIEAIDHTKPTANRKLYPYSVFREALQSNAISNMMRNGSWLGENEHPRIYMHSENGNSQQNIFNNMTRVARLEANNEAHYVVAYKCTPEKTYFKIRTSLNNLTIVKDILVGRRPTFSIRTMGDFTPNAEGVSVATRLEIVTIDYVANPANATSHAEPILKLIDPANQEVITLEQLPKTGTESESRLINFIGNRKLVIDKSLSSMESIYCMNLIEECPEEKTFAEQIQIASVNFL